MLPAQPGGKAYPLERGIVCPFCHGVIRKRRYDFFRHGFAGRQVIYNNLPAVYGHAEEEYLKIG